MWRGREGGETEKERERKREKKQEREWEGGDKVRDGGKGGRDGGGKMWVGIHTMCVYVLRDGGKDEGNWMYVDKEWIEDDGALRKQEGSKEILML